MSEPYLGEIRMVGFGFAPRGWAKCDGQLLPISQNQALFSLLYWTYGGDQQRNFALPDLRGRVPLHRGAGPGLTPRLRGESAGTESVSVSSVPAGSAGGEALVCKATAPVSNLQPYTVVNFIICLSGCSFPFRD